MEEINRKAMDDELQKSHDRIERYGTLTECHHCGKKMANVYPLPGYGIVCTACYKFITGGMP